MTNYAQIADSGAGWGACPAVTYWFRRLGKHKQREEDAGG